MPYLTVQETSKRLLDIAILKPTAQGTTDKLLQPNILEFAAPFHGYN